MNKRTGFFTASLFALLSFLSLNASADVLVWGTGVWGDTWDGDNDYDAIGDSIDLDDDNDGMPDYIDADTLNAAVANEKTLLLNSGFKGSSINGNVLAQ